MVIMLPDRKSTYKVPPTTITDRLVSQEARRAKALEDQKRRRAERVYSTRNLDQFADLSLGGDSDDEDAGPHVPPTLGVAQFAGLLSQSDSSSSCPNVSQPLEGMIGGPSKTPKKNKKKKKKKKPSKWADKCMYAELLEMVSDQPWSNSPGSDGLPTDLENGWVAVGPVPVGKRCLAITHQSSGVAGVVPNTTLRSRLLGKVLIQRFPSVLPPMTILDCILDANWKENGILHILDVIKWKGQDISDCEASFRQVLLDLGVTFSNIPGLYRFWWRDTRLTELSQGAPAAINFSINTSHNAAGSPMTSQGHHYRFSYPNTLIPVPYTLDTGLNALYHSIIPAARSSRSIPISIPTAPPTMTLVEEGAMDVDFAARGLTGLPSAAMETLHAIVPSDGLLLYVKEASYEAGTSPLSSWIPTTSLEGGHEEKENIGQVGDVSPLDLFQSLVGMRIANAGLTPTTVEIDM